MIIYILLLHFIGDFCLQTKWMAESKSKNWEALTAHVFVYCLTLFCGIGVTGMFSINDLCRFAIINFIIHLVIDSITSRCTKIALEHKNMHVFFAIVGFDQFLHNVTLLLTTQHLLQ